MVWCWVCWLTSVARIFHWLHPFYAIHQVFYFHLTLLAICTWLMRVAIFFYTDFLFQVYVVRIEFSTVSKGFYVVFELLVRGWSETAIVLLEEREHEVAYSIVQAGGSYWTILKLPLEGGTVVFLNATWSTSTPRLSSSVAKHFQSIHPFRKHFKKWVVAVTKIKWPLMFYSNHF